MPITKNALIRLNDVRKRINEMNKSYSQMLKRFYETYNGADEKLSPVVREIAPQAEQIFRDQYVMEFIGGKEYKHENNMKAALIRPSSN